MGRRSINTTKSGKYMNPTDQARKEARKKELKKNKKQRQMVRAAVLKMKDPTQILEELEKIDEMEYNVLQPPPLNEKVLKEKRKKLRETLDRVLKMYDKDDPEKWVELKRQEMEYEKKRAHLISYYESVKHAQAVQVDDIPLPTLQVPDNLIYGNLPSQIPLPMDISQPPTKSILKKDSVYKEVPHGLEPPGVPPGVPPDFNLLLLDEYSCDHEKEKEKEKKSIRFSHMADEGPPGEETNKTADHSDVDGEEMDEDDYSPQPSPPAAPKNKPTAPKPTSLQQRMLALSGQNIDDFMREMEEVHKKRERERAADLNARLSALKRPVDPSNSRDSDSDSDPEPTQPPADFPLHPPGSEMTNMTIPPPMMPPGLRPPPLGPLPVIPGVMPPPGLRMPPGPPLGRPPMLPGPPGPPPGLPRLLRPPGPPPGAPPRLLRPLGPPPQKPNQVSVLTAAPQLIQKKDSQGATISAKPQIRNLSADVTRFVPSALRVKREDKKNKPGTKPGAPQRPADVPKQAPSKDDAYMQFMKEMEGLL